MCIKCQEAMNLLTATFGEERAKYLLWEETCFPMDGDTALEQAKGLVAAEEKRRALEG